MKLSFTIKPVLLVVVTLILLLILSFLLRANYLFFGDFYFLPDQARDILLVKDMVETMKPPLIGARAMSGGYVFHGPLWIWLLGIPFSLFHGDVMSIAYTYIFISLAIVASGFIVSYLLYGLRTAFFTGLLISTSSLLVYNVQGTTNAHLMPLVFVFFLYFYIRYLRGNTKSFYLAAFLAGLGVQFQGVFAVPLFIYLLLTSLFTDKYILSLKHAVVTALSFTIPLGTFFLFDIRHEFLMMKGLANMLTDQKGLGVIPGYEQYGNLGYRIADRITGFLSLPYFVSLYRSYPTFTLLWSILIGSIFIVKKPAFKQDRKEMLALLFIPAFIYLVYVYFSYPVWEHYVFSLTIVAAFICSIAINKIWDYLPGKILIGALLIAIIASVFYKFDTDYFPLNNSVKASDGSYRNQVAVADYIYNDAQGKQVGYFVYSPQVFTYGMDYLLWWKGKYAYNSLPKAEKTDVFYLIMYPPLQGDADAHQFWIKNVIKTQGIILDKKIFPGNITVEKRQIEATNEAQVDPNYYLNVR